MLRAVLDANEFVSAVLTRHGNAAKILDAFRDNRFDLVLSKPILEEIERVLSYPKLRKRHGWFASEIRAFLEGLERFCIMVKDPKKRGPIVHEDPSDDFYLWAAMDGDAEYLVTGDRHLLVLRQHEGVRIVTAREFLDILSG